jgi:hypothetical protein
MIFNGMPWLDVNQVWRLILHTVKRWRLLFKDHMDPGVEILCDKVSSMLHTLPALEW